MTSLIMKCREPEIVFDLENLISSYGENRLELELKGDVLFVSVFFNDNEKKESEIIFCFDHTVYHSFQSMPGVKMNNIKYTRSLQHLTKLIEFRLSEVAKEWENHFNNLFKFRHFNIYFQEENKYLEIISKDFKVVDSKK